MSNNKKKTNALSMIKRGISDCKRGFLASNSNYYYSLGYGRQYEKEQQISGVCHGN